MMLGGAVAGTLLTSFNYRRLGHTHLATTTLLLGVVSACLDAVLRSPEGFSRFVAVAFFFQAMRDGSLFDAHVAAGGARASSLRAAGAAVLGFAARVVVGMIAAWNEV